MYVTPQSFYDEGLNSTAYPEPHVTSRILTAQSIILGVTGKWFEPQAKTYQLDGNGREELWLPQPIVTITSIERKTADQTWEPFGLQNFAVYDTLPEDWDQPMIAIAVFDRNLDTGGDLYCFTRGRRNWKIVGTFGYCLDNDGTVPDDIKLATQLLAQEFMDTFGDGEMQAELARRGLKREDVRGHEHEWQIGKLGQLTGNAEVDMLLKPWAQQYGDGGSCDFV